MLILFASLCAGIALVTSAMLLRADYCMARLRDVPLPANGGSAPSVSIIVAARNESRDIEKAIKSLLELAYAPYQLTVVNDRSTDDSGKILDRLANEYTQLNVVHLKDLPEGWLGKNHAQHLGALSSDGKWLLFTDADIIFDPTSLARAVAWAEDQGLDHLAGIPRVAVKGFLLNSVVAAFAVFFKAHFRPWRARNPKSKAFIGIGAFNLVRADAYHAIGGHEQLKMRPDDDIKLGKVLKQSGFRQDLIIAGTMLSVRWYASITELIRGLEKNAFAAVEYNPFTVLVSTTAAFLFFVAPFAGVFLATGLPQVLFGITALLWLLCCWHACRGFQQNPLFCLGFPIATLLLIYIQWRTMLLNYWLGGIRWRDTFYPLSELRSNRV